MQQSLPDDESVARQRAASSLATFAWRTVVVIVLLGAAALVCYVAEILLLDTRWPLWAGLLLWRPC